MAVDAVKEKALADYRKKLLEHKEVLYVVPYCYLTLYCKYTSKLINNSDCSNPGGRQTQGVEGSAQRSTESVR
jgi:hypothetical protein